jgi:hypothetical protein
MAHEEHHHNGTLGTSPQWHIRNVITIAEVSTVKPGLDSIQTAEFPRYSAIDIERQCSRIRRDNAAYVGSIGSYLLKAMNSQTVNVFY